MGGEAVSADGCLWLQLLAGAGGGAPGPVQGQRRGHSDKSTHINTELLAVFEEVGGKGATVLELPALTT